jgi:hypothetical protein
MTCTGNCKDCNCKNTMNYQDDIWDESGFQIGSASVLGLMNKSIVEDKNISYKYAEDRMIADLKAYIDKTYVEHYMTEDQSIECFDAWIALGDSTPTFRNTALKYLWRYGKKNGNNKKDLMKALHYIMMCLYVDHYKDEK